MLTESQVAKARTFPGCSDITAETATDKLFAAAEALQSSVGKESPDKTALSLRVTQLEGELSQARASLPVRMPTEVLKAMAGASRTYMEMAVNRQAISPVVAEQLALRLIGSDDAPSAIGLTPGSNGECVASAIFKILAGNTPMPHLGMDAGIQPAPKTANGAPDDNKPISEARLKALMEQTPLGQAALSTAN